MHEFEATLWRVPEGSWHFVTVPDDLSDVIAEAVDPHRPGFGSMRVSVSVGTSTWSTSVFPSAELRAYVLPVNKQVRSREGIDVGSLVRVRLELA